MLHLWIPEGSAALIAFFGILFAFGGTVFATAKLMHILPKDAGREFAHDGKKSAGKPRGAGIIFVLAFVIAALLFAPISAENLIYLALIVVCMITGFMDDASEKPWGEYKKGFLDLCVAALLALTFLKFNSNMVTLAFFGISYPAAHCIRVAHYCAGMDLSERDQLCRRRGWLVGNLDDHHGYDDLLYRSDPWKGREFFLLDLTVCGLYSGVSVV